MPRTTNTAKDAPPKQSRGILSPDNQLPKLKFSKLPQTWLLHWGPQSKYILQATYIESGARSPFWCAVVRYLLIAPFVINGPKTAFFQIPLNISRTNYHKWIWGSSAWFQSYKQKILKNLAQNSVYFFPQEFWKFTNIQKFVSRYSSLKFMLKIFSLV